MSSSYRSQMISPAPPLCW